MSRTQLISLALVLASSLLSGCAARMGYEETETGYVVFDPQTNICYTEDEEGNRVDVPCDPEQPGLSPMNDDPKTVGCQMGQCCDPFVEGTCP